MTVSVFSAAKRLCELNDWSISNLDLQKLLYLAHMVRLGRTGESLIDGGFEAWNYGPVQPSLYHRAKVFGSDPVGNVFHTAGPVVPGQDLDAIQEISEQLKGAAPGKLVAITHWEQGAWAKHYHPSYRGMPIPNEDIQQEYLDMMVSF